MVHTLYPPHLGVLRRQVGYGSPNRRLLWGLSGLFFSGDPRRREEMSYSQRGMLVYLMSGYGNGGGCVFGVMTGRQVDSTSG